MARLHSPTTLFQRLTTAPTSGDGTVYPLIATNLDTAPGQAALDVYASMVARSLRWEISYSMTQTSRWEFGDADHTSFDFVGSASGTYTTDSAIDIATEKQLAFGYSPESLITGFVFAGRINAGSWTGTKTSDLGIDTGTGHFLVGASGAWLNSLARPIIVGTSAYLPFLVEIDFEPAATSGTLAPPYDSMGGSYNSTVSASGPVVGSWAQQTPDWRAGIGMASLGCALYGDDQITAYRPKRVSSSISCSVTARPIETLEYGYDPADRTARSTINRIWNSDGTASVDPLTAPFL